MNKQVKHGLILFLVITLLIAAVTAFMFDQLRNEIKEVKWIILFVGALLILISGLVVSGVSVFLNEVDKDKKEGEKMEKVLVGLDVAKVYRQNIKKEIEKEEGRPPHLCVILVGNNPASLSYIKGKEKACAEVGMTSTLIHLDENISQDELMKEVMKQNEDNEVDGILVQLPLPKHLNEKEVIGILDPKKDVDGLHPINMGKLMLNEKGFVPCTPLGVMALIKETKIDLKGKRAVVIGRSPLVGNSVAQLLMRENATVTICHSKTEDMPSICKEADVLVVAMGKAKFITKDYIKKGAVVIDVGVNRNEERKLVGDVDFDQVIDEVSVITPVPRGVGPMTITMLLENTLQAYRNR